MKKLINHIEKYCFQQCNRQLRFLLNPNSMSEIVAKILKYLNDDNINYFSFTTFAQDFYTSSDLTKKGKINLFGS